MHVIYIIYMELLGYRNSGPCGGQKTTGEVGEVEKEDDKVHTIKNMAIQQIRSKPKIREA